MSGKAEETLRSAYSAFNARDLDAAVELMHPAVDWPNAWEGGRVAGREAVREYWRIRYRLEDGLVVRMDVLEPDQ